MTTSYGKKSLLLEKMNFDKLNISANQSYDTILECVQHGTSQYYCKKYLQHIVFSYIKERFYSMKVRKYFYSDETLPEIQENILQNRSIDDELILQSLASNLDLKIQFLRFKNSNYITPTVFPIKEPEVDYKYNEHIAILKTQTDTKCSYSLLSAEEANLHL